MISRLTIFYNPHEQEHTNIRELAEQTGMNLTFLPTSGPYTIWTRANDNAIEGTYRGPTAVKHLLNSLLEKKAS